MDLRAYHPAQDADGLWQLKEAFERELGSESGDDATAERYDQKITAGYRDRYLEWVERCVEETPECLAVAESSQGLVGYVFILPESFAMIWDAAVLNEIFVIPKYRGNRVADELIERGLEVARNQELPMNRCILDVDPTNPRARRFYERHGFEPWGELVAKPLT